MVSRVFFSLSLITMVTAFLTNENFHYPECAPPGTVVVSKNLPVGTNAPPVPQLGRKFQTLLEGNILEDKTTAVAEEYFDGYRDVAVVRTLSSKTRDYYILDYANNNIIDVKTDTQGRRTCHTSDLRHSYIRGFFESKPSPKYAPKISSTVEALRMAKSNGLMYLGKSTVRGITTDHWQSCMYWEYGPFNFTMDLYFAEAGWISPYFYNQIPVQYALVMSDTWDSSNKHDLYSYMNFKVLNESEEFDEPYPFQVPVDIICTGNQTNSTKTIPPFPDNYTYVFEQEIVKDDAGKQSVTIQKIWHDSRHKLFRLDHLSSGSQSTQCPPGTTTREIRDFLTGHSYCIDDTLGNCSILPLRHEFIVQDNAGQRMQNMSELLFVNPTSQYRGQRMARSIKSDVFVSNYPNGQTSNDHEPEVVTHFFSLDRPSSLPLRVDVKPADGSSKRQYNIYNFKAMDPQYLDFDITNCFDDKSLVPVTISLKGINSQQEFQQIRQSLLTTIVESVASKTRMPFIRVQKADLRFQAGTVTFTCLIAGTPPSAGTTNSSVDEPSIVDVVDSLHTLVANGKLSFTVGVDE